ncbi:MAG: 3-hydroxybutyryl-CoA dehydrogenase [Bacteroidetes bacterium QS_9_68_14]|nr:MAG: 3-hydroxybutyryl-CoA dehydrogenase [Bacteroidetes bacterium QS_9_68_14]
MTNVENVTVVGAGTMGSGIAHVFAQSGCAVALVDQSEDLLAAGIQTIEKNLGRQLEKEKITTEERDQTLRRVAQRTDLADGAAEADLVVEAVTEKEAVKKDVFQTLDQHAPAEAILASNTSSISITWLGAQTERPERVIGMHFFNPVPMMSLVEVVRGLETTDAVYDTTEGLAEDLGKDPVEVADFPGFVSNRILMPMINEAVFCLMEGVADAEDIDTVMTLGMNHPMGPLTLADFIGLDVCLSIMEVLHTQLGDDKYRPCPLLRQKVTAGHLGRKSGQGFFGYE